MGFFNTLPTDLIQQIVLFLDARSLANLIITSKSAYDMICQLPNIHIKISNREFNGDFPKFLEICRDYFDQKMARNKEIAEIDALKKSRNLLKSDLEAWSVRSEDKLFEDINITEEEIQFTGCFCVFGIVGGAVASCFLPVSGWLLSIGLGASLGATPLIVSRTLKCLCGVCLSCKEQRIKEREPNLDANFSLSQFIERERNLDSDLPLPQYNAKERNLDSDLGTSQLMMQM
ncbi:hypothetical protein TUM19329_00060 [Legionella antarctica]|uniref:F-box domain-containing protein n=2 Tax=Legionella antarctica TaxID=2708020 RepID=A0A6F8SZ11_9GAMM|nr:hypothetical protein TUM19329_00060 [Legionella antarctica]